MLNDFFANVFLQHFFEQYFVHFFLQAPHEGAIGACIGGGEQLGGNGAQPAGIVGAQFEGGAQLCGGGIGVQLGVCAQGDATEAGNCGGGATAHPGGRGGHPAGIAGVQVAGGEHNGTGSIGAHPGVGVQGDGIAGGRKTICGGAIAVKGGQERGGGGQPIGICGVQSIGEAQPAGTTGAHWGVGVHSGGGWFGIGGPGGLDPSLTGGISPIHRNKSMH